MKCMTIFTSNYVGFQAHLAREFVFSFFFYPIGLVFGMFSLFTDKTKKAGTCCSCAARDGQMETTEAQCVPAGKIISFCTHPVSLGIKLDSAATT